MHKQGQSLIGTRRLAGINLVEVEMQAGAVVPANRFPFASFQIVLSGGYYEPSCDASRPPGSVHFHPPEDAQSARVGLRSRVFGVCVADGFLGNLQWPKEATDLCDPWIAQCLLRLRRELHQPDDVSELAASCLAGELIVGLTRTSAPKTGHKGWLSIAYAALSDDPARKYSLAELADLCAVHPGHLARSFRRAYGCSVGEFQRKSRIELAKGHLRDGSLTIEDIAVRAGFCDAAHLCRALKRATGKKPSEMRGEFQKKLRRSN